MSKDKITLSQDTLNALNQLKKKSTDLSMNQKILKVVRDISKLQKNLMVLMNENQRKRLKWDCGGYIIHPDSKNPRVVLSISEVNYAHQMIVYYLSRSNYINIENVNKLNYDLPDSIKVRFDIGSIKAESTFGERKLDEFLSNLVSEHLKKVHEIMETQPISLQGCNVYDSDSETIHIFPNGFDDVDFYSPYQGGWINEDVDLILPEDSILNQPEIREFMEHNDVYTCRDYIKDKLNVPLGFNFDIDSE